MKKFPVVMQKHAVGSSAVLLSALDQSDEV